MNFNTYEFLFLFFVPFVVLFYLLPKSWRIPLICLGSLIFYSCSGLLPVILISSTIIWSYIWGIIIEKRRSKFLLFIFCLNPFGTLFLFKYLPLSFHIFGQTIDPSSPLGFFVVNLLPAGISFYTFECGCYVFDIFKGELKADRNFSRFTAFVTFFPHLIAGPILRYHELQPQLANASKIEARNVRFFDGFFYLSLGLFYKVFFADILVTFHKAARYAPLKTAWDAFYEIVSYSSIIYFDFWGYSLMAMGLALMIGFNLPRNFVEPYKSRSPKEFWRRWHVTLSYWLKDYVYFSLGGNRRYARNIFIIFALCGLWHGGSTNFVAWGVAHAIYVVSYHYTRRFWDKMPSPLQVFITYGLVTITWPMFYSGWRQYMGLLQKLFSFDASIHQATPSGGQWIYLIVTLLWIFLFKEDKYVFAEKQEWKWWKPVIVALLFCLSIIFLSFKQTFIYFQF